MKCELCSTGFRMPHNRLCLACGESIARVWRIMYPPQAISLQGIPDKPMSETEQWIAAVNQVKPYIGV